MPKYKVTLTKKYIINVEARTAKLAEAQAWEKHEKNMKMNMDFPSSVKSSHVRIREEKKEELTSNQKKKVERQLREEMKKDE